MKTIGLLGGMSWESTLQYYRLLNEGTRAACGGLHSADILLRSLDFAEVEFMQRNGDWDEAGRLLAEEGLKLQSAGAECVLLCTNTMHKASERLEHSLSVPFLHIADATGQAIVNDKRTRIGLLGTRFTMEDTFYRERLKNRFGLEALIPEPQDREVIHSIIYNELCRGIIQESSRIQYRRIIDCLRTAGAQAVILGCTEISLLIRPEDSPLPTYDTTTLHAEAAIAWAIN